jgi:ABC-type dipeptide/oligopeptide/nickel transport system permease subunit
MESETVPGAGRVRGGADLVGRVLSALASIWRADSFRRFRRNRLGMLCASWLLLVVLAVLIGPYFAVDPNKIDLFHRLAGPSRQHIFGTDELGRDLFSRVLEGGRATLTVALLATVIPFVIGMVLGTIAGYRRGAIDELLTRFFDVLITFPALIFGIILAVAMHPSEESEIIALSITQIALYARLFRAGVLSAKQTDYVQSAVSLGFRPTRVVLRHIIPNIVLPIVVVAASHIGILAIAEASLSFLGAGIQPPAASLGNIISDGQQFLQTAPWMALIPGVILTTIAAAFSFVADNLRDAFDVQQPVATADQVVLAETVAA